MNQERGEASRAGESHLASLARGAGNRRTGGEHECTADRHGRKDEAHHAKLGQKLQVVVVRGGPRKAETRRLVLEEARIEIAHADAKQRIGTNQMNGVLPDRHAAFAHVIGAEGGEPFDERGWCEEKEREHAAEHQTGSQPPAPPAGRAAFGGEHAHHDERTECRERASFREREQNHHEQRECDAQAGASLDGVKSGQQATMAAASQGADSVDRGKRHHHLEQAGKMVSVVVGAQDRRVCQGLCKCPHGLHDSQADKRHARKPPAPH